MITVFPNWSLGGSFFYELQCPQTGEAGVSDFQGSPLAVCTFETRALATSETLYHGDGALLYIAYVMLIWAAPVPADRWHCSLWP